MGALVFGVFLTVALSLYTMRRFKSTRAEMAILGACGLAAAFMVAVAMSDSARQELANRDVRKILVIKNAFALVGSSPWLGYGRGAFESVYPSVARGTGYMTFQNPENIVAQWTIEWGVPVAAAAAALFAWALRPNSVLAAARPAVGPWAAIVAVVIGDLVDFHLEVPGIVALVAVCAALVLAKRMRSRGSSDVGARPAMRRASMALAVVAVVAIGAALPALRHSLAEDRRTLGAMASDASVPREEFQKAIRSALERAPGEPFFPLVGAVRAQRTGEESVLPWIAAALERYPRFGRAHYVLARSLALRPEHAAQARLEYRLAYEYDAEELTDQIIREAERLVEDPSTALELVPEGPGGVVMLEGLVARIAARLPSTSFALDRELERRAPESTKVLERKVAAGLSDLRNEHPWCEARERCLADALAAAATLTAREPTQCSPHLLVARLRVEEGRPRQALDDLEDASNRVTDRIACKRALMSLARELGEKRRADAVFEGLVRGGCGSAAECADLYLWAASVEQARGNTAAAISLYRRAADAAPERDDIYVSLADLAARAGLFGEAMNAYTILARRHPEAPEWRTKAEDMRSRMLERVPGTTTNGPLRPSLRAP
jgi:tetratricopeptide (TPR) repeat protein